MSLQKIPHDTTKYRNNPVELLNLANRLRIGATPGTSSKISPTMTANNAPSPYVISADAQYTTYYAYLAFDENNSTYWNHGGAFPGWLKIDFGSALYAVTRYDILCGATYLTAWTFYGSNDNTNWTLLDSKSSQDTSTIKSYSFSNSTKFRYYRLSCTSMNTGWGFVSTLDLYATPTTNYNYIGA